MDPADGKIHKATREEFEKIWTGILVLLEPNETFEKGNKKTSLTIKFGGVI